jgi:hypothetical protein
MLCCYTGGLRLRVREACRPLEGQLGEGLIEMIIWNNVPIITISMLVDSSRLQLEYAVPLHWYRGTRESFFVFPSSPVDFQTPKDLTRVFCASLRLFCIETVGRLNAVY